MALTRGKQSGRGKGNDMTDPEDEEFERIEVEKVRASGWRKRQIEDAKELRCPTCQQLLIPADSDGNQ